VAWTQAAFGEEMVFRGFLLTRLEILLGHGVSATVSAVTGQALLKSPASSCPPGWTQGT